MDDDELARWSRCRQVPAVVHPGGVLAHAAGVALWLGPVLLFRAGLEIELSGIWTSGFPEVLDRPLDFAGWIDDAPADLGVRITLDDRDLDVAPLESGGAPGQPCVVTGSASTDSWGARARGSIWVPSVPARSFGVLATSSTLGVSGRIDLDATGWTDAAADVLEI